MEITICICTYNRYDYLTKAIESAMSQDLERSRYKIIVIDNSPDHAAAEEFGKTFSDLPFLTYHVEKTPGLSNARNVGARMSGTPFIAFMDDDAIASPHWASTILSAFERFGEKVAVVGGKVEPMWEIPRPDWLGDNLLSFVSAVDWGGDARIAKEGEWLAGTNIAFRTDVVLDAGGFDVRLGRIGGGSSLLSNEEILITQHLSDKGYSSAYLPNAWVRHLVERKRIDQTWFRKRVIWQAVSDYMADPQTMLKHAQEGYDWCMSCLFELPPQDRTIRGLSVPTDDPIAFRRQLDVLHLYTGLMLSGFEGIEDLDAGRKPGRSQ